MRPWIPNFTHYRIIIEEGKISGNNGEITTANLGSKYHTFETQVQVHIYCCGMFCKPKFESELIRCRYDWNVRYSWTGWPLVTMLELYTMEMCTSVIHQSIFLEKPCSLKSQLFQNPAMHDISQFASINNQPLPQFYLPNR